MRLPVMNNNRKFKLLKALFGIRVKAEDEIEGMDLSEHGIRAYSQSAIDDSLVLEDDGNIDIKTSAPAKAARVSTDNMV
jgi:hypothetical protein